MLDAENTLMTMSPAPTNYHKAVENQGSKCAHGFREAYKNAGSVKFAPRQFLNPTKYMTQNETDMELEKMNELLNDVTNNNPNLDPNLIATTRATNVVISGLDATWRDQDDKITDQLGSSSSMAQS